MSALEDDVFMNVAKNLSRLSKCASMSVGAIFVSNGRVIATGVNGTVSGDHNCCELHQGPSPEHSQWSLDYEIHAEMNLILELARSSVTFDVGKVYTTHSPCQNCLKHLLGLRGPGKIITEIVFETKYYKVQDEYLHKQIQYASNFGVNLRKI